MNDVVFPNQSPGRVGALACLKRFHVEQVLKQMPSQPFSRALAYGSAVHETLKAVFDPRGSRAPAERDVRAIAKAALARQPYPDASVREEDLDRCIVTVEAYRQRGEDDAKTLAVEVFHEFTCTHASRRPLTLSAMFDRLLVRNDVPDQLVVRDYKTGKSGPVDLNGACISIAVASKCFTQYSNWSVEYEYLDERGLAARQIVTREDAKQVWPELKERALQVYNATDFPAEPGEYCACCPLRKECQPQVVADWEELDKVFQ